MTHEDRTDDQLIGSALEEAKRLSKALHRPVQPTDRIPGFDLVREIRRGGQGVVYEAIQQSTKRRVAVKVLHGGAPRHQGAMARFEREVHILGQFRHPNIVSIHDSGSANGRFYYVMDYIVGEPIDEHVRRNHPNTRQVLILFAKVCSALTAAHLRGVIHRDLKPDNVRVNSNGEPCVLDFGLAKMVAEDRSAQAARTITGEFLGSLPWASPEQVDAVSEAIDLRTDVYSLGVMLHQLLTGRFPYTVDGPVFEVIENIRTQEPDRAWMRGHGLDDEVCTIVCKCLAKPREHRYQSAGDLARDIRRYLAGEPIEAKRDSRWYVMGKFVRRHKFAAGLALAVLLAIAGMGIGLSVMYARLQNSFAKLTEAEVSRARFFQGFLAELLTSVNPLLAKGRDTKLLRDLVDNAAKRIEAESAKAPLVEALIRDTIGNAYLSLGEVHPAAIQLERAVILRKGALGEDHPETLSAMFNLAQALNNQETAIRSEELFRRVYEARRRIFGPEHRDTLLALNRLGAAIRSQGIIGRHPETEKIRRHAFEAAQRALGPHDHHTLAFAADLCKSLSDLNRWDEAEELQRASLVLCEKASGEIDPLVQSLYLGLGGTYYDRENFSAAAEYYRQSWEAAARTYGESHTETKNALGSYAGALFKAREFDKANEAFLTLLDLEEKDFEGREFRRGRTQLNYAACLEKQGRTGEALNFYREAEAIGSKVLENHAFIWAYRAHLGRCLYKMGFDAEAVRYLESSIPNLETMWGMEFSLTTETKEHLIKLYERNGRLAEARQLRESLPEGLRRELAENRRSHKHP